MGCKNRLKDNCKKDGRPCIFSKECFDPEEQKPKTNADRIRAMSDDELAEIISSNAYTGACNDFGIPHENCGGNCRECVSKWLQQPAKESE